jgi:hypothetical protein
VNHLESKAIQDV